MLFKFLLDPVGFGRILKGILSEIITVMAALSIKQVFNYISVSILVSTTEEHGLKNSSINVAYCRGFDRGKAK